MFGFFFWKNNYNFSEKTPKQQILSRNFYSSRKAKKFWITIPLVLDNRCFSSIPTIVGVRFLTFYYRDIAMIVKKWSFGNFSIKTKQPLEFCNESTATPCPWSWTFDRTLIRVYLIRLKSHPKLWKRPKSRPRTVPATDFKIVFRVAPNYPKRLFN